MRRTPDELPREWLPDPVSGGGEQDPAVWDERLRTLMAAAAPRLAELRQAGTPWWEILGSWWKPIAGATAVATAGLVLLLALSSSSAPGARSAGALALRAVVGEGEPVVLWADLGEEVDPVLALIVVEAETR